ncbi:MAG: thiosulfate dehydrogenase (quinone) large subunit, partial [Thermoplasmata archaeon]|nr:thiosulfate dehydrogenase (quinone) large subunit [Thermoplasmata archaeon]
MSGLQTLIAGSGAMPGMADKAATAWALLRIALGWIFFWPFLDKTFGLGFRTPHDGAWIRGGHP